MSLDNFAKFTKRNLLDAVVIGGFISSALYGFYDHIFEDVFHKIINIFTHSKSEHDKDAIVSFMKLFLVFLIIFIFRKNLK